MRVRVPTAGRSRVVLLAVLFFGRPLRAFLEPTTRVGALSEACPLFIIARKHLLDQ